MRRLFPITILMLLMVSSIASQTIEKFSIDSGGASTIVGDIHVFYTIGEVVIQEISTPTVLVSEGFINSSFNSTLSTEENQLSQSNISIYPNPTSQFINITSDLPISKVELFDALGRSVMLSTTVRNPIDVSKFNAGVYFLRLYVDSNSVVKRVVIE